MSHNKIASQHAALYQYIASRRTDSQQQQNNGVKIITHHRRLPLSAELSPIREETLRWLERQRRQARVRGAK
jgi:hypothetical protein